uniref:Ankyrin repeat-containing protein n=1 Tax=Borely moumouvirus TaxID=2712067 RepID=A0A6G6AC39_9VIRU
MSLVVREIINSGDYNEFYKFIIGLDSISEEIVRISANFILNPFKEKYFEILYNEVSNKSPENIIYIINSCIHNNNVEALELLIKNGFDITTLAFHINFNPFYQICCTRFHTKCEKKCEYEILTKFFLDNGFYSYIDLFFFISVEYKKYCVCDVLLNYGYSINYSNPNIMDIISSYIGDEQSLRYLFNKCDLQINFSNPQIKKMILHVIKYKKYKCLQLLINHGLNLYDIVQEINKVEKNEYLSNTLKILIDHGLDTETICKLLHD